jgi:hypothetical protein
MFHDSELRKQNNAIWYTCLAMTIVAVGGFMWFVMSSN